MIFDPPIVAASLSGESDAEWARSAAPYVGSAFLGGIALDEPTREAARELIARDRNEFLPEDPVEFIDDQLSALTEVSLVPGFNVRTTSLGPLVDAAKVCKHHDAILEVNAHCRQDEMCAVGAGETLLSDTDRLVEYVSAAANEDARVSVKLRTEVDGVDLPETCRAAADAGAEFVHVDAMDSEPMIAAVARAVTDKDCAVIANNGIRDRETVREYLDCGADAVSVGRPSNDPVVLGRIQKAVMELTGEVSQ